MKRQPNSAFAVINYGRTMHVCMDIHCPCGYHNHLDTWGDMGSAEYVRCAECKDVLRIGADVNLLDKREDFDVKRDAYTFIQWKGTDVVMQAHCTCGKTFDIERDFAYECDCPHCGKHYHCESCLEVTKLTPEETAAVTHVQEPEKDYEDMDDEERAAYDKKMGNDQPVVASTLFDKVIAGHTHRCCGECDEAEARARQVVEVGHLVSPRGYAPQTILLLGDVVDGGIGSRLLSLMLPGNHEVGGADFPSVHTGRIVVLPDIHVPAADDQTMQALRRWLDNLGEGGSGKKS